jgi:hypothetical protein
MEAERGGIVLITSVEKVYTLKQVDLCVFDRQAWSLLMDLKVMVDTAKVFPLS